jgi:hypothetical protein
MCRTIDITDEYAIVIIMNILRLMTKFVGSVVSITLDAFSKSHYGG